MNKLLNAKPDILKGSIAKTLIILTLPLMLSHIMQTLYNMTDAFWLGKLGKASLAAPTITFNVVFLVIALSSGLAIAGTTLIGQHKGAGNYRMMNFVAGNIYSIIFLIAIVLSVLGYIFAPYILKLLYTPKDTFYLTLVYMRIIFTGIPFVFGYYVFQSIFQGMGNTVIPMKVSIFTVILNIILDPLLIFGIGPFPRMQVAGAGIATVISQSIASIIGLYLLFSGKYSIKLAYKHFKLKADIIKDILKIGIPLSLGQIGTSLGFTVLMGIVNTLGTATIGAFGIGNRIISLLVMPAMGLARGVAIMVAQNIGAGNIKRAERSVWVGVLINSIVILFFTTLLFFFGEYVVKFFINESEVILIGRALFKITSYSVLFFSIMIVFNGAFQGSGYTLPVFVLQLSRLWLLRVPIAIVFVKLLDYGHNGLFWAMFLSNSIIAFVSFIWFKTDTWKHKAIKIKNIDKEIIIAMDD